jgi:hypothetical protein
MKRLHLIAAAVLLSAASYSYAQEEPTTADLASNNYDLVLDPSIEGSGTLWYNGNFNGVNGLSSERNTIVSDARTYDDFCVPAGQTWTITAVFGEFLASTIWTMAHWEIRQGVNVGTGGTLIAECPASGATRVATGRSGFGFTEYRATSGGFLFDLADGCYHLTVAPIGNGQGRAFVSTTSGLNGVDPLINDNSFFDSTFFGVNWGRARDQLGGPSDFAYGLEGTRRTPDATN